MNERVRSRERFKLSAAVFLLLIQNNQILVMLRTDTGWMDGQYSVPSGVKESKETLSQALVREAAEEIGVTIDPEDLLLVHIMHNFTTGQEWIGSFFKAERWHGQPELKEPHKHSEMRWVDLLNLPKNLSPYTRQALQHYLVQSLYSEFGWDVPEEADEDAYLTKKGD